MKKSLMTFLLLGAASLCATASENYNEKENTDTQKTKPCHLDKLPPEIVLNIYEYMDPNNENRATKKQNLKELYKTSKFYDSSMQNFRKAQGHSFVRKFPMLSKFDEIKDIVVKDLANASYGKAFSMLEMINIFINNEEIINSIFAFSGNSIPLEYFKAFFDKSNPEKSTRISTLTDLIREEKIQSILEEFFSNEYTQAQNKIIKIIKQLEFKEISRQPNNDFKFINIPASLIVELGNDEKMETKIRKRAKKINEFYTVSADILQDEYNQKTSQQNKISCLRFEEDIIEKLLSIKTKKEEKSIKIIEIPMFFENLLKTNSNENIKITINNDFIFQEYFYGIDIFKHLSKYNSTELESKLKSIGNHREELFKYCKNITDYNSSIEALLRCNPEQIQILANNNDNILVSKLKPLEYATAFIRPLAAFNIKTTKSILNNASHFFKDDIIDADKIEGVLNELSEYSSSQITAISEHGSIFIKNRKNPENVIKAFSECSAPTIEEIAQSARKLSPESIDDIISVMLRHRKSIPEDMAVEFFKLDENQVSIVMDKIYNSLEKRKGMPASELWEIFHEACNLSGKEKSILIL